MYPDVPYFIILLCLMSDDFTHQGEGNNRPMHPLNPLSGNVLLICPALLFHSLYCFTLLFVSVVDVFGGVVARVPCSPSLCIIDDLLKIST